MEIRAMELDTENEGYGYGNTSGYGEGYGDGYSYGDGYGDGYSYGYYDGYGYGDTYGYGYGDGNGDGDGYDNTLKIYIPKDNAFTAYHYIKKTCKGYIMRNDQVIKAGEELYEKEIELCVKGLHASLNVKDAKRYAPNNSVLTTVKVWGNMLFDKDKLVATNRMIIKEAGE